MNIETVFEGMMDAAYPEGVSAIQYEECRRVFYAGLHVLLCHMRTFTDEVEGDAELNRLFIETCGFAELLGKAHRR